MEGSIEDHWEIKNGSEEKLIFDDDLTINKW